MKRTLVTLSGWLTAAAVLVTVGGSWAYSQGSFQTGEFVTAPDGSRWAVGNGVKVQLDSSLDDRNALATLRDGGRARTLGEALQAIGSGSPQPAPSGPAPVAATPADSLVGQSVNACFGGDTYDFTVLQAFWLDQVENASAGRGAKFVALIVDLTVTSNQPTAQPGNRNVQIRDERNRVYDVSGFGPINDTPFADEHWAAQYGAVSHLQIYAPGIPVTTYAVYKVPADTQRFTLVPGRLLCGS